MKGKIPLYCAGCPMLEDKEIPRPELKLFSFAITAQCNLECIYCTTMQTDLSTMPCTAKEAGENFAAILNYFDANARVAPDAEVWFSGGEISISPAREKLLSFAEAHPGYRHQFFSNCVMYSEKIAEVLEKSHKSFITCDLDAGTPETYFLVKGYNHFDRVVNNLKAYAKHGKVCLKYIVLPGFNTMDADYIGTIKLMQELGVSNLILSPDCQHPRDEFMERKLVYETARFKKMLEDHQLTASISEEHFGQRHAMLIERFYKQM